MDTETKERWCSLCGEPMDEDTPGVICELGNACEKCISEGSHKLATDMLGSRASLYPHLTNSLTYQALFQILTTDKYTLGNLQSVVSELQTSSYTSVLDLIEHLLSEVGVTTYLDDHSIPEEQDIIMLYPSHPTLTS